RAERARAAGHPPVRHRAADPRDGGGRRCGAGRGAGRPDLRGGGGGGVTARILIVAGSDSGGGAGIQADIRTVTMLGGHPMTAIAVITAQNTQGVSAVHAVPTDMVIAQIDAVADDIGVDAVKIGMIGSPETAGAVADRLARMAG